MRTISEQFDKIAEEAIQKAEAVECSFAAFVDGLSEIVGAIHARAELAKDELKNMDVE